MPAPPRPDWGSHVRAHAGAPWRHTRVPAGTHACTRRDTRAAAQAPSASAGLVFPRADLPAAPLPRVPAQPGCASLRAPGAGGARPGRSPGRELEPREPGRFLTLGVLRTSPPPAARWPRLSPHPLDAGPAGIPFPVLWQCQRWGHTALSYSICIPSLASDIL